MDNGSMSPMDVSIGDKILLPEYGGSLIEIGDEEFHLVRNQDILGKYE
jgi:chaperonin GroES